MEKEAVTFPQEFPEFMEAVSDSGIEYFSGYCHGLVAMVDRLFPGSERKVLITITDHDGNAMSHFDVRDYIKHL